jgi:hypothetical protein
MLHPIPVGKETGGLVSVMRGQWSTTPPPPFSYLDYRDLRDRNQSLDGMLAYHHDWLTLTDGAAPERIYVANVSANYFDGLGIRPVLDRFFLSGEEARGGGRSLCRVELYALADTIWWRSGDHRKVS